MRTTLTAIGLIILSSSQVLACDQYEILLRESILSTQGEIVQDGEDSFIRLTLNDERTIDYNFAFAIPKSDGTITCRVNPRMRDAFAKEVEE